VTCGSTNTAAGRHEAVRVIIYSGCLRHNRTPSNCFKEPLGGHDLWQSQ
jgi:hypothetical protein